MSRTYWDNEPGISEQAAFWLIELEEAGPDTLQAFGTWLRASPRHVEEFLLATAVWREFDGFDSAHRLQIQHILNEVTANVLQLDAAGNASAPPSAPSRWRRSAGAARWRRSQGVIAAVAMLVMVAGLLGWFVASTGPQVYATDMGEQRAFKLQDGSLIHLNTQSRVEVQFSEETRTVRLLDGEAMFSVERDPARPFRVVSGDAVIQAIGTQFNVYRREDRTTVSVVEGVVQISPPGLKAAERLAAGEQATVSPTREIVREQVADVAQAIAWRQRRLVFRGESLDEVAREFNRYNQMQIRVEGETVRDKRLTATFDADDPASLVQFLEQDAELAVANVGDEVVIRAR